MSINLYHKNNMEMILTPIVLALSILAVRYMDNR